MMLVIVEIRFYLTFTVTSLHRDSNFQREKKNLQDLPSVYVLKFTDSEYLDMPTARLIKEFDNIEGATHGLCTTHMYGHKT